MNFPVGKLVEGLGLSTAVNKAHGKCPVLPKSINSNTGKASTITLAFNNNGWGNVSRSFMKSAMRITQSTAQFKRLRKLQRSFLRAVLALWTV